MSEDRFISGKMSPGFRRDTAELAATLPTEKQDAFFRHHVAAGEPEPSYDEMGNLFHEAQDAMERLGGVLEMDLSTAYPVGMTGALSYIFQLRRLMDA